MAFAPRVPPSHWRSAVTLRGRVFVLISTMTLGTLAFSLASVYFVVNRIQERVLDRELVGAARQEADAESKMADDIGITGAPGPVANSAAPLPRYAALFDPEGGLHAVTPTVREASFVQLSRGIRHAMLDPFDVELGSTKLRAVVARVPLHPGWRLLFGLPRADVDRDNWLIGGSMLVVFAIALAASVGVIRVVAARLARGHLAIADTAKRFTEGDLSARVGIHQGKDELALLSRDIDRTFEQLERLVESVQAFVAHANSRSRVRSSNAAE
jgi:methyl-accepting chemotaxis protein